MCFRILCLAAVFNLALLESSSATDPVRVLVWDEQQSVKARVYENFPGNYIADYLKKNPALQVRSASIHDAGQGLTTEALEKTDVLVFWGHVRHGDISEAKSREIVDRIKEGKLQMITLHSAHWSLPFMIAMEERAIEDALARLPVDQRARAKVEFLGKRERKTPPVEKRLSFETQYVRGNDGATTIKLERPNCVFPTCCTPKQPSQVRIILKDHPITDGVPSTFTIPETEMYDEPYHVPAPDLLVFDETWAGGEYFRSGCLWDVGKGKVFYFRPGDQQYAVYKEEPILRIIENACAWLGGAG